ncbi:MAG: tRNA dihydrouridine synthase DusB [Rhodospirillales bacterium]|jgi:tRNA-dihydrouridine synthase B|nr:tRNA dihydrouridine synthase DusB [Rhodospirillales bacterium]
MLKPVNIGPLEIDDPIVLAPMSGVTDMPFRRLVKRAGAGLVVSEMIASRAMVHAARKTMKMATHCADEYPISVQLAGCEPDVMAEAARINEDFGAAIIDINMGCPVKKVTNGDAGSALMRDLGLASKLLEVTVKAINIPVTLKMRTGWDDDTRNAPQLAKIAEDCGIQAIAVHGRTRCQFYKGRADWPFIASVKDAVNIPVFGNGDVVSVDDAKKLLEDSGADGILVGRGTYGRPWFLNQISHYLKTGERLADPTVEAQMEIVLEHFDAIVSHYGAQPGVKIARKHLGWYSKGLSNSAEFRQEVFQLDTPDAVKARIRAFYGPIVECLAA